MSIFQAQQTLTNKLTITICKSMCFSLSECFGGATSTPALGYWMSNTVGLVKKYYMIFAYASDTDLQANIEKVISFCENLKTELTQESIALEINGEMYFHLNNPINTACIILLIINKSYIVQS